MNTSMLLLFTTLYILLQVSLHIGTGTGVGTGVYACGRFGNDIYNSMVQVHSQSRSHGHFHLMQSVAKDPFNRTLGTSQSCPTGDSFNVTFLAPAVETPNMNVTVAASGSCIQPNGSATYQGGLTMVNRQNGNNFTAACSMYIDVYVYVYVYLSLYVYIYLIVYINAKRTE